MKTLPVSGARRALMSASLFAIATVLASVPKHADAQSCPAPVDWVPSVINPNFQASTCGQSQVGLGFCQDLYDNPGPNYVLRFFLHPTTTEITLSGGAIGFDPVMYVSTTPDGCADGPCVNSGSAGSPMPVDFMPSGIYYLTVAAAGNDGPGSCGNFSLNMNGDFEGGDDIIFANGFD